MRSALPRRLDRSAKRGAERPCLTQRRSLGFASLRSGRRGFLTSSHLKELEVARLDVVGLVSHGGGVFAQRLDVREWLAARAILYQAVPPAQCPHLDIHLLGLRRHRPATE